MKQNLSDKPENAARIRFPVLEGMEAAANQLGCPLSLLRAVKKGGSRAFLTHNRIDTGLLLPELFAALAKGSELPDGVKSPQDWLATEKAKREAIKRQVDEKSVVPTADAVRQAGEAMAFAFAELERRDRELPPVLAGLSAVEIFKKMSVDTESIRKNLQMKFQEIGK